MSNSYATERCKEAKMMAIRASPLKDEPIAAMIDLIDVDRCLDLM